MINIYIELIIIDITNQYRNRIADFPFTLFSKPKTEKMRIKI